MTDKQTLRREVLARREALSWEEIGEKSRQIAVRLFALPAYRQAATVMYFLNFGKEVQTLDMVTASLAHGKRVVAPKTVHSERRMILSEILDVALDLAPGRWGIPEPKPERLRPVAADEIDFVLVPGVAFDERGNRLGYGGGYYDRFFAELREDVPLVALTFEVQVVPEVPVASWDRQIDIILTEERLILNPR
ncbi:MAG: 5-formyltetrahydrofolate cyclo-ligase [Dethiobacter sp.]|nr:5-formyltetrahydrofolate cyclo-ligase [Dethiobacter sp.]